jgi:hypothetical protein
MADKNRRFSIKVKKKEWKKEIFERERERERKGGGAEQTREDLCFLGGGFFFFGGPRSNRSLVPFSRLTTALSLPLASRLAGNEK